MNARNTRHARRHALRLIGAAALALPLAAASHAALAQSGWQAEWNRTLEAAKKEGALAVAGSRSPDARRVMTALWKRDFPDIDLNYTVGSSTSWVPRVLAERGADKFLWDAFCTGPTGGFTLGQNGALDPLLGHLILPDVKDEKTWNGGFEELFIDNARRVAGPFVQPATVWYDEKKVAPDKVNRLGLAILLEPEYKGKIVWQDPRIGGPGQNYSLLIHEILGEAALRKIVVDQESVFYNSASEATEALVRGKALFLIGVQASTLDQFKGQGIGRNAKPFGNSGKVAFNGVGGMVLAIMNRPAHPNAAKIFVNWMLTKEIQNALADADKFNSLRRDVAPHAAAGMMAIEGEKYVNTSAERILVKKKGVRDLMKKLRPN
jgi:iron(III) transport system substrate-binding protein